MCNDGSPASANILGHGDLCSFDLGLIGRITKLDVEILSVSARIAGADLINEAHAKGKEVHVWTVNDEAQMSRFIDLGADNLITDRPAVAKALLETRESLGGNERLLLKMRTWLWN